MGKLIGGINGKVTGKIGNLVYYILNGETVVRAAPRISVKNLSDKQLAVRLRMSISLAFLGPLREFIRLGYQEYAKKSSATSFNLAISEVIKNAVTGIYPDLSVDPAKVLVAKGHLPNSVEKPEVIVVDNQLMFSWNRDAFPEWPRANDRVMLMAYIPEIKEAIYNLSGAQRRNGYDSLAFNETWKGKKVETYLAFRSEDGKKFSHSVYTGSLII